MNYEEHYRRLISRAVGRSVSGYVERHHVIPKCMGGSNDKTNIVALTAKEHFVAHELLVKINPGVRGLAVAILRMSKNCNQGRVYSWLRKRAADAGRGNKHRLGMKQTPRMREALRKSHIGRKNTPEAIAKMSIVAIGNKHALGTTHKKSAAHKAILSRLAIGRPSPNKGRPMSEEQKAILRGKIKTPEHRAKLAAATRAHYQRKREASIQQGAR